MHLFSVFWGGFSLVRFYFHFRFDAKINCRDCKMTTSMTTSQKKSGTSTAGEIQLSGRVAVAKYGCFSVTSFKSFRRGSHFLLKNPVRAVTFHTELPFHFRESGAHGPKPSSLRATFDRLPTVPYFFSCCLNVAVWPDSL